MTDCPRGDVRDSLPELVHGRLDADARAEVERHVAGCPACAREVELLEAMRAALGASPAAPAAPAAPVVDIARIAAAVNATRRAPVPQVRSAGPWRGRWHGWRAAAAIAAVTVGVMSWAAARRAGDRASRPPGADARAGSTPEMVAVAPSGRPDGAPRQANAARPASPERSSSTAHPESPWPASVPPAAPRQVAQQPRGLAADGGVSDLPDSDLRELLESIDRLDALPDAEPAPAVGPVGLDDVDAGAI
ncbi:MAG TPA: zf-HC2 domain-containing protein [Gemmatimonadaceae bacterium]